jgi:DNA polymerase I-like protein with 3'-5' exonuclease and polymerase domains
MSLLPAELTSLDPQSQIEHLCRALNGKMTGESAFKCSCPAFDHEDKNPSCSFFISNGAVRVKCHSRNCSLQKIAAGVTTKLQGAGTPSASNASQTTAEIRSGFKTAEDYLRHKGLRETLLQREEVSLNRETRSISFKLTSEGKEKGRHTIQYSALNAKGSTVKTTHGTLAGASIHFSGDSRLAIAEGPLDGMSLADALGVTCLVSCGADNMINIQVPFENYREVTVVADNDEAGLKAGFALAERLLRENNIPVYFFKPNPPGQRVDPWGLGDDACGYDFNDLLRDVGPESASQSFYNNRVLYESVRKKFWPEIIERHEYSCTPYPLQAMPTVAREYIEAMAHHLQTPPDRLIMACLVVTGILMCPTYRLSMRTKNNSFTISPNAYGNLIGTPSSKKSPSMSAFTKLLRPLIEAESVRYQNELADHHVKLATLSAKEKRLVSSLSRGTKDPAQATDSEAQLGKLAREKLQFQANPPRFDLLMTNDSTPEALLELCANSEKGLLLCVDEAGKLFMQLSRESFAELRPLLNTGFSGQDSFRSDRVTAKSRWVKRLMLGFLGTVQPEIMKPLLETPDDGFPARMWVAYPQDYPAVFINEQWDRSVERKLQELLSRIYGMTTERVLEFDAQSIQILEQQFLLVEREKQSAGLISKHYEGFLGKFESHFGKICLILQVLHDPDATKISESTALAACEIFTAICSHFKKLVSENLAACPLEKAIRAGRLDKIKTTRDLKRSNLLNGDEAGLDIAIKRAQQKGLIMIIQRKTAGRPTDTIVLSPFLTRSNTPQDQVVTELPKESFNTSVPCDGAVSEKSCIFANNPAELENPNFRTWIPSTGFLGCTLAIDTETTRIKDNETPELKLLQATADGETVYFVSPQHARAFMETHRESKIIAHNFSFDLAVPQKATGFDFSLYLEQAGKKIVDTGLMYQLLKLATEGEVPHRWSLEVLSYELLKETLKKDPGIRVSWDDIPTEAGDDPLIVLTTEQQQYAANDVIMTYRCYLELDQRTASLPYKTDLTLPIQMQAAWALDRIGRRGVQVDQKLLGARLEQSESAISKQTAILTGLGYTPGAKGNRRLIEDEVVRVCGKLKTQPRISEKSQKPKIDENAIAALADGSELLRAYLTFSQIKKHHDFLRKLSCERVHPRFQTLMRTGRTSCREPNLQNLPRVGVREILIPSAGHLFIIADYTAIELTTLSQHCLTRYGGSKMAELINGGKDLHIELARHILNKDDVTKADRQKAKALNFGIPGGLGAEKLCEYAASTFGIAMTVNEAKSFKKEYLKFFPEIETHLKSGDGNNETVSTLSGRIAARSSYCQARNFAFQGLASDGAKRALYNLEKEGFRTVLFVHDEVVVEVPCVGSDDDSLNKAGTRIEEIMTASMQEFTPEVTVKVEWFAADRYTKEGKLTTTESGRVIPYTVTVEEATHAV